MQIRSKGFLLEWEFESRRIVEEVFLFSRARLEVRVLVSFDHKKAGMLVEGCTMNSCEVTRYEQCYKVAFNI